ncbi:cytochrome P450 [Micromonospora echinofusca]|uniref:Cytochrome P450 n=1 Tax=Micromonospora echinofusca TaxID=47858 RepID=A0ABS3VX84_MICEH|nr:cytochrome P450 [Micromonospora echinofusca]MBO4209161.1 cytochrome P450 [Micromonospora echinofusca]
MATTPRDPSPESTLNFAREGYRFIGERCERYDSDIFQARLLLRPTICLRGRAAAELFYDDDRFQRHGAAPGRLQRTLTGVGGVQGLDGSAHRRRKGMFLSLMTPAGIGDLTRLFAGAWQDRLPDWQRRGRIVLHDEVGGLLTRAVHGWAGVPLPESAVRRRYRELRAMVESGARVGPGYWRGRLARRRAEHRIAELVTRVRSGALPVPAGCALRVVAEHLDANGRPLSSRIAAVEVLNVLRPTVAIDRYVTFTALALREHPEWVDRVRADEDAARQFVQEVRRYYPFFPAAVAKVRRSFDWRGHHFPRGRRVLLDLYGTDHHGGLWSDPERFRPERFAGVTPDAFSLVPQGGGDHVTGHRCAGEWVTIALMETALRQLTTGMRYEVPPQDLTVDLRRVPTGPASGLVLTGIRTAN